MEDSQQQTMEDLQKQTMEDVLCIITCEAVIILGMKEILETNDSERLVRSPPLKKLINFEEEKLPLAMGFLKLENALYMFGGELLSADSFMRGCIHFGCGNPGKDVLKWDLCNPHSKPVSVGKLKRAKLFPYVFKFNSKIYILSTQPDSFEAWDPVTAESFILPSPPLSILGINGYFLTERGIVMGVNGPKALFFNTHDEKWEILWELWECPTGMNLQDWGSLQGVQGAGNKDFFLWIAGESIALVNVLKTSEKQSWDLIDRYWDLMGEFNIEVDMACIANSSEQEPRYNCLLLPCINYKEKKMRIIIDVFRVHRNTSSKRSREGLFSLFSVRKHVYEFNYHTRRERSCLYFFHDAHIWSLPQVSKIGKEYMEGSNDRNTQDSTNAE